MVLVVVVVVEMVVVVAMVVVVDVVVVVNGWWWWRLPKAPQLCQLQDFTSPHSVKLAFVLFLQIFPACHLAHGVR